MQPYGECVSPEGEEVGSQRDWLGVVEGGETQVGRRVREGWVTREMSLRVWNA